MSWIFLFEIFKSISKALIYEYCSFSMSKRDFAVFSSIFPESLSRNFIEIPAFRWNDVSCSNLQTKQSSDWRFMIYELRFKYRSLSLSDCYRTKWESALFSVFSMRVFEREISSSIHEIPQIIRMIFRNDGT